MSFKTRMLTLSAVGTLVGAALAGCPVGTPAPSTTPTPAASPTAAPQADAEGCEHLQEGPEVAVTAVAIEATSNVPTVNAEHTRYDVTLIASGSAKAGKVLYNSGAAGDYVLFLNADVPVTVRNSMGALVELESSATSSTACDTIQGRHVVELGVGAYSLVFGPTQRASVSVVIEETSH